MKEVFKVDLKLIEDNFDFKIDKELISVGLDVATKTGTCIAKVEDNYISFEVDLFDLSKFDLIYKYINCFKYFNDFIKKVEVGNRNLKVTIENSFFVKNQKTLIMLSRLNFIPYLICLLNGINVEYQAPLSIRAKLNCTAKSCKKEDVQKIFLSKLNINREIDNNIIDAMMLGLYGIILKDSKEEIKITKSRKTKNVTKK